MKPLPGDIVIAFSSGDCLIEDGCKGVIEGIQGQYKPQYEVTFNMSPGPWWTQDIISSSGGPVKVISSDQLIPAKQKIRQKFFTWKNFPCKNGAIQIQKEVNLFFWLGKEARQEEVK